VYGTGAMFLAGGSPEVKVVAIFCSSLSGVSR